MRKLSREGLREAMAELAARDADFARAHDEVGVPPLRRRRQGFETLLRAIVAQQVSVAAASAIWGRVQATVDPLEPRRFLKAGDAALRAAGLSRQKIAYGRGLASDIVTGRVRLDRLGRMSDEDAIAELVKIKGIGRWSAEVYLLFAHGRADMWPVDDVGLMVGMQRIKRLDERPRRAEMLVLGEPWRPWRGAAALFLWHYLRNAAM
ncbi:MAG TPA: DNA-3-methyladenine glycosylase 2 family protein [Alphaproteobacteria bacterium]|jgi:DNA-3-methyladenine glycosylase II|nr:DNA-3-methyladenine glycosylase 2 family protein [Alphaproteobacteria bacterium]